MTTCVSSDLTVLTNSNTTISNCIEQSLTGGSAVFPAGSVIQTCMNTAGVSTGCSQCWANLFDNVKGCIMDTCGLGAAISAGQPPSMTQPSQPCIDCLTNMSNQFNPGATICGINPDAMGGMDALRNEVGNLLPRDGNSTTSTTSGKSAATTTLSLRSITTTLFVFTLIMVSI